MRLVTLGNAFSGRSPIYAHSQIGCMSTKSHRSTSGALTSLDVSHCSWPSAAPCSRWVFVSSSFAADATAPGILATAPYYFSELSRFLGQGWLPLPPRPPPPPPPPPPPTLQVTVQLVDSKGHFLNSPAAACEMLCFFDVPLACLMRYETYCPLVNSETSLPCNCTRSGMFCSSEAVYES